MNNTFDWNRFCEVVKKDFRNMWPMFGTTILILAALPFAVWLFMAVLGIDKAMPPDFRLIMIETLAMLAAVMAPSRMYRTWNLRNEGIYFAMLPASKLEKYCSALLFSLVVCPLAVYLGGMVLDMFLTLLPFGAWHDWLWQGVMGFPFILDLSTLGDMAANAYNEEMFMHYGTLWVLCSWLGYISSVLMFMFTSTLFKRHKVLQTLLWMYLIEFVLSIVLIPVSIAVFSSSNFMEWLMNITEYYSSEQFANWMFGIGIVFNVVLIALFGWLTWRRLNKMTY